MDETTIPSSIADIDASWMAAALGQPITGVNHEPVSYTHLTLPTILRV